MSKQKILITSATFLIAATGFSYFLYSRHSHKLQVQKMKTQKTQLITLLNKLSLKLSPIFLNYATRINNILNSQRSSLQITSFLENQLLQALQLAQENFCNANHMSVAQLEEWINLFISDPDVKKKQDMLEGAVPVALKGQIPQLPFEYAPIITQKEYMVQFNYNYNYPFIAYKCHQIYKLVTKMSQDITPKIHSQIKKRVSPIPQHIKDWFFNQLQINTNNFWNIKEILRINGYSHSRNDPTFLKQNSQIKKEYSKILNDIFNKEIIPTFEKDPSRFSDTEIEDYWNNAKHALDLFILVDSESEENSPYDASCQEEVAEEIIIPHEE